ncbi:MAG: lytic transglycosylase domain-containing protein [bacterium]
MAKFLIVFIAFSFLFFTNICYGDSYGKIVNAVYTASKDFDVPSALVLSVMEEESDFNINAVSPAGAIGLMQLMPATAKQIGVNPYNPIQNIVGGVYYLRYCLNLKNNNIALALACYNAGPNGGVPNPTYNYIRNIARFYKEISR